MPNPKRYESKDSYLSLIEVVFLCQREWGNKANPDQLAFIDLARKANLKSNPEDNGDGYAYAYYYDDPKYLQPQINCSVNYFVVDFPVGNVLVSLHCPLKVLKISTVQLWWQELRENRLADFLNRVNEDD